MNAYRIAANAVFSLHWIWTAALLAGFFAQFAFPRYGLIEIVALVLTLASQARWKLCPLTLVENALRARYAPQETYGGSFLRHHAKKRLGMDIPRGLIPKVLKLMLAISVVVLISTLRF